MLGESPRVTGMSCHGCVMYSPLALGLCKALPVSADQGPVQHTTTNTSTQRGVPRNSDLFLPSIHIHA